MSCVGLFLRIILKFLDVLKKSLKRSINALGSRILSVVLPNGNKSCYRVSHVLVAS